MKPTRIRPEFVILLTIFGIFFTAQSLALPIPAGIQIGLTSAQATDMGFTQCFDTAGNSTGTSLDNILAGCQGDHLMMAVYNTKTPLVYSIAAAATFSDVTMDTGNNTSVTHNANGVSWYFNNNRSWGFTQLGNVVDKNLCDSNTSNIGMCWHTDANTLINGFGFNAGSGFQPMSGPSFWRRVLLVANNQPAAVPAPPLFLMFATGLFAIVGRSYHRVREVA